MSIWPHECRVKGCRHKDEWCDRRRDRCDYLILDHPHEPVRACGQPTTWLSQPNSGMYPLAYCDEHAGQVSTQELADLRELRRLVVAWCDAEDEPHGREATQRWLEAHTALREAVGR